MYKGRHLLIDCRNVAREVCLNDKLVLNAMARAAERAGATVISQVRYKFGQDSPPGFAAVVMLDESHCSAHSYADLGLIAMDVFTCGKTNPRDVFFYLQEELNLGDVQVREAGRFAVNEDAEEGTVLPSLEREGIGVLTRTA
ncbi:MAG TPA: adenosylmethionine decarboxylase [Candidatus Hydrogenedentes bacterium]|nr:adenosylmethionine decarboxylase [Candidatus Hydrogenedentota bacterium]HQH51683.1 adenosylmethionine decarboxylase [Candidatus Hydrogenedentota bacterium]HQM50482.1 adenosylmethionine decarboxylase [Candidatus Hydrogenedentota bacterium]